MKSKELFGIIILALSTLSGCNNRYKEISVEEQNEIISKIAINMYESYRKFDDIFSISILTKDLEAETTLITEFDNTNKISYNLVKDNDETYQYYTFMDGLDYVEVFPLTESYKVVDVNHGSLLYWDESNLEIDIVINEVIELEVSLLNDIYALINNKLYNSFYPNTDINYEFKYRDDDSIKGKITQAYETKREVINFEIVDNILINYSIDEYLNLNNIGTYSIELEKIDNITVPSYSNYTLDEFGVIVGSKLSEELKDEMLREVVASSNKTPTKYEITHTVQGITNKYIGHYDPNNNLLHIYSETSNKTEDVYLIYSQDKPEIYIYDAINKKYSVIENYDTLEIVVLWNEYYKTYRERFSTYSSLIINKVEDFSKACEVYVNRPGDFTIRSNNDFNSFIVKYNFGVLSYMKYSSYDDVDIEIKIENNVILTLPSFEEYEEAL